MRRATITNSFNKGVLDPRISERNDLAHTYQSLVEAENTVFTPQGGCTDRGGTTLVSDADVLAAGIARRLRRRLEPIVLTSAMVTAINGGTAANVVDYGGAKLVTNAVAATPFSIVEVDFGAARMVAAIDVIDISVATVGVNECLVAEYYDGVAWRTFGGAFDNAARKHVRTASRTRRFAGWPGQVASSRYWRIVLYGAAGAGAVSLDGLRFWAETMVVSPSRLLEMARSPSENYQLVMTDRNIDVFQNMRWQAAIAIPVSAHQIVSLWPESSLDTLLLFHEDVQTLSVVRQGSPGEWDVRPVPWTNVPLLKVTTAFSGSQDEIQTISLGAITAGRQVVLALGDALSAPVTYSSDAAFATAAVTAIGAMLASLGGNATDLAIVALGGGNFRVSFINANGSRAWPPLTPYVLGATAAVPAPVVVQPGLDTSSSLFGVRSGWPRCGAFVQSRLMLAGFRAAPTSWAMSVVAQYYDYTPIGNPATADRSFVRALDVAEVETIRAVYVGRHIQVFTDSGEWYLESRTIDATAVQNAVLATRHGIEPSVPLVFAEGATLFCQKGGMTLRDFLYTNVEQSYTAEAVTVLAPHLLTGITDMAHRKARNVREGNQVLMVNADGSAAMLTLLKSQDVVAMAPWRTPSGAFRRAMVDINHNLLMIIERDGNLYLEKWVPDMPLDAATSVSGTAITTVSGLPFPDGRVVWAYADGDLAGPLVVTGGAITLPAPAATVIVGIAPPWRMRLPVIRGKPNEGPPFRPPCRIFAAELALDATGDVTIAVNGGRHRPVALLRTDASFARGGPLQTPDGGAPGLPMLQRLYTGNRRVEGLTGWTETPFVELSRAVPARVHIKSVRVEIAYNG